MFKLYRNLKTSTRYLFISSFTLLSLAIAYSYGYNAVLAGSIVLAAGVLLEVIAFKGRLLLASMIVLVQLFYITLTAEAVSVIMLPSESLLISAVLQSVSLVGTLIYLAVAYKFSKGRIWVNLLIAYFVMDLGFYGFLAIFGAENYPLSIVLSSLGGLIYLALRGLVGRKSTNFDLSTNDASIQNKTKKFLKSEGFETNVNSKLLDNYVIDAIAIDKDKQSLYAIYTLPFNSKIEVKENIIQSGEDDITKMLPSFISEVNYFAKEKKVNSLSLLPVILTHKNNLPRNILNVKVTSRNQPDKRLGEVFIVNREGLSKLKSKATKVPSRDYKKITKLVSN